MAQTERMDRLLRVDAKNPSGYRIVGWEKKETDEREHKICSWQKSSIWPEDGWMLGDDNISYDSFEPGIKNGDEWFFAGDVIILKEEKRILDYHEGMWKLYRPICYKERRGAVIYSTPMGKLKRIGNIHEEGE